MMATTHRARLERLADTAARNTLHRAGIINPTAEQDRASHRCAMRHLLQELASTDPDALAELHAELTAADPDRMAAARRAAALIPTA